MYGQVLLPLLLFVASTNAVWYGWDFYNTRFSVGFDQTTDEFLVWSDYSSSKADNFYYSSGTYSGSTCTCSCNEATGVVTGCDGDVYLKNYNIVNLTVTTFASTTTSVTIIGIPQLTVIEEGTFHNLTSLTSLIIHRTGITVVPDISNTQIWLLMLGDNNIRLFAHNYTQINWPSQLTHVALQDNNLDYIPNYYFSASNIEFMQLARNRLWSYPFLAFRNLPNLKHLGLSENLIEQVSTEHLSGNSYSKSNLLSLNLSNNAISYIEPSALAGLQDLILLELHANNMQIAMKGVFADMPKLEYLSLNHNQLERMYSHSLTNIPELKELRLHSQTPAMTNIYYNAFVNINANLYELWVSDNNLVSFPHQVLFEQNYHSLTKVYADSNSISNPAHYGMDGFPEDQGPLWFVKKNKWIKWNVTTPNIQVLYLGSNGISVLENETFCGLAILNLLNLRSNSLTEETTSIPTNLFDCNPVLQILDLGVNYLQYLPEALTSNQHLQSIQTLSLDYNRLTVVPSGSFSNHSQLTFLALQSNLIVTVEDESFPDSIQSIYLNDNQLRFTHPNTFSNLTELSYLSLQNNYISTIYSTTFQNCTGLSSLYLSSNQLGWLNSSMFADCTSLNIFSASYNEIALLGDDTFNHLTNMYRLDLSYNKLTELSKTSKDFHDISITYLDLQGNQLTSVQTDTFNSSSVTWLYLQDNQVAYVESNAFVDMSVSYLYLTGNPLKYLHSFAFNRGSYYQLHLESNEIRYLVSNTFYDLSGTYLYLSYNQIQYIEESTFYVSFSNIYLQGNGLTDILGAMFNMSSVNTLYLNDNDLTSLLPVTFVGLTAVYVPLYQNEIAIYPGDALSVLNLETVDLRYNAISEIPDGSFDSATSLRDLYLDSNYVTHLQSNLFDNAVQLEVLSASDNNIAYLADGLLDNCPNIESMLLSDNNIYHIPQIGVNRSDITSLSIDLLNNPIGSIAYGALDYIGSGSVSLSATSLQCGCAMYQSLVESGVEVGGTSATCGYPPSVAGIDLLSTSLYTGAAEDFVCAPVNLNYSQPSINEIDLFWSLEGVDTSISYSFYVRCWTPLDSTATELNATVTDTNTHTFIESDGVIDDTIYLCVVHLATNATTYTAASDPVSFTSLLDTRKNIVAQLGDIELPIQYYDFSITHDDFNGLPLSFTVDSPSYVPSPYGAWLAISDSPSLDSFSNWFRLEQDISFEFNGTIILEGIAAEGTHRFYSSAWYPVDYLGWLDEGETDCSGVPSNLAFTSAIRTGFVFQGNESISISGGEMMWLYLNRKLVLQVFNEESNSVKTCKRINITQAAETGGTVLTPEGGVVVNGKCAVTEDLTSESVHLQLEIGERYHFTIFHVERQGCGSQLLIDATDFDFILDTLEEPPRDYIVYIDEDFYVDGIIETIVLADSFSVGPPFHVNILRGNEARHISLKNATAANAAVAATAVPTAVNHTYTDISVDGTNHVFVECDGPAMKIADGNTSDIEYFEVTTETLYVTLATEVDYEVATAYTLIVEVIDYLKVPALTGQVTIKVKLNDINDNCPVLDVRDYYIVGIPPMSSTPYLTLTATDADSTVNAQLSYYRSSPQLDPPFEELANDTYDIYRQIYPLNSNFTFSVIVLDNGTPTRGTTANVTYEISNTCLIDTWFTYIPTDQTIDVDTGELRAVVPGYYSEPYACDGSAGIELGWVRDSLMTASTEQEYAEANRARLNAVTLPPIVEGLSDGFSGGWRPEISDANPWLQVDLETLYVFSGLAIQGHDEMSYWVTRFSLNYSDGNSTWYQHVNSSTGIAIEYDLTGVTGGNETTYIDLDPWIYSRYVRLLVLDWNRNVSVRMELYGCQQEELAYWNRACLRCETTWFCEGDGSHLPCGRCEPVQSNSTCGRSPTEHSFGYRTECEVCPVGWTCVDGYGTPCPAYHYSTCNETSCNNCTQCEPGYACRGGVRYECIVGTYSDGYTDFCLPCEPGYYQNETGQASCTPCIAGYSSTRGRDRCTVCSTNTYSTSAGLCQGCANEADCPCLSSVSPCFAGTVCRNTRIGSHICESCPPGFSGDGVTCTDINECSDHLPCFDSNRCIDTEPGFQCLACPLGYTGTFEDAWAFNYTDRVFELFNVQRDELPHQTCEDINECDTNNGGCDINSHCVNTLGSFYCGFCKEGYMGNSLYECYSNNFCTSNHSIHHHKCSMYADCIFTGPGTYKCECINGWAGDGFICAEDPDQDGLPTVAQSCAEYTCNRDNCASVPNSGQEDNDGDWIGDVCDNDDDNDGVEDLSDNCQYDYNRDQSDMDSDNIGDVCDNCNMTSNANQLDADVDGIGDACDPDEDDDGILSASDNCPLHANVAQSDADGDGIGDVCDNCPSTSNVNQTDTDEDGIGDVCEDRDTDGDGIQDSIDNCMYTANSEQADTDSDGMGDRCDPDIDDDMIDNTEDNCPYVANANQLDTDEDYVGNACEADYDNDGVDDKYDDCPANAAITTTDLSSYTNVNLYPELNASDPAWLVLHDGKEVRQMVQTDMPAMMIGDYSYDAMDYSGTVFANSDICDGYLGFVFGYQNNRRFYVAIWRHNHLNFPPDYAAGIKGLQIKAVSSSADPSYSLAYNLWNSVDSTDVRLLYHDPWLRNWQCKTSYKFYIKHRPEIGLIRVIIKYQEDLITDSGDIYDTTISGGRVGLFTFQQDFGIWSNLRVQCMETVNRALQLGGVSDYVNIGSVSEPQIDIMESFTMSLWFYIEDISSAMSPYPLICSQQDTICLSILNNGTAVAVYGSYQLLHTVSVNSLGWTNVIYRYNAEDLMITLTMNGTNTDTLYLVEPFSWNATMDHSLYLGKSSTHYFQGYIDEVRIYDINVPDDDLDLVWQHPTYVDAAMKEHLKVHYTMNDDSDYVDELINTGYLAEGGIIYGAPQFIKSTMHRSRFKLTYPYNRRRRSLYDQLSRKSQQMRTVMAAERLRKHRSISRKLAPELRTERETDEL